MTKSVSLAKYIIILILLGIEVFALTGNMESYVLNQQYLTLGIVFTIQTIGLVSLIYLTFSLTVGMWERYIWNFLTSIFFGVFFLIGLRNYDINYIIILSLGTIIVLTFSGYSSFKTKNNLVRFDPKVTLRSYLVTLGFVISFVGASIVWFNHVEIEKINLGKIISGKFSAPIEKIVMSRINDQLGTNDMDLDFENPLVIETLNNMGLSGSLEYIKNNPEVLDNIKKPDISLNFGLIIENQVNSWVEPYRQYFTAIISLLVFTALQFYVFIANLLFSLLVIPLFWILKKLGFFHIELKQVDQEQLKL